MKQHLLIILGVFSVNLYCQNSDENVFSETFSEMFNTPITYEIEPQGVGNPEVPLDGGLTALLVAGGAVGYRKYRARSKKN